MRNLELPEGHAIKEKIKPYYYTMNVLYGLAIVMSVIPKTAPICTSLAIYPLSMLWCSILFLANSGFFMYCAFNNYLQTEVTDESSEKTFLLKNDEYVAKQRKIYNERMSSYGNYLKILTVLQIAVILIGRVYVDTGEYLACTGGGYQWISTSIQGELFVAFMMVTIMMQSAMCEKFLYRVPNKNGMFESIKI